MSAETTINDLRKKMVENQKNGLPAGEGIDRDEIRDALKTLRASRTYDATKTTKGKSTVKKKAAAKPKLSTQDLNDLLDI